MKRPLLAAVLALGGCVYLNTLYNARTYYREAERARLAGQAAEARSSYATALDKAAESFRRDSLGGWAYPSLLLVGQASFRLGALVEGRLALERVLTEASDAELRQEAGLYLGAVLVESGEYAAALPLLNDALRETERRTLRAEGHLWRGRALLALGREDQGWWDFGRAVDQDRRLAIPVYFERMAWGLSRDEPPVAGDGARGLLEDPSGGIWADSLSTLVRQASRNWSPRAAAELLAPVRTAPWPPAPRDQILLQRIQLLLDSGDTLAAETELGWAGREAGPGSVPARLALASVRLQSVVSPDELNAVRRVLLPVATDSAVVVELERIRILELLTDPGTASFPSLFAGGELARDVLGATRLAGALFVQAARDTAAGPWRGKAALAALALGGDTDSMAALRLDLLRGRNPYLARARNRYLPTDTLARLDGVLQARLDSVLDWAHAEARRRDVLVRGGEASN